MQTLTQQEAQLLDELIRIAGASVVVTAQQLHEHNFPDFVARVFASKAVFRQSLENRKLQVLQAKGYVRMERGKYTIISRE